MSQENFFQVIEQELKNGYGIIPLIGSGMSFQSGIMLGSDIGNYLNTLFCHIFLDRKPIDLHREGWPPPFPDSEVAIARDKIKTLYVDTCTKYGVDVVGDDEIRIKNFGIGTAFHPIEFARYINTYLARPYCPEILRSISVDINEHDEATKVILSALPECSDSLEYKNFPVFQQDHVVEIGLRSLHDWTSALNFFARLQYDYTKRRYSFHEEADPVIIDSFNTNMVGNRKPNQNHFLLTHLVSTLNIKNIITTNFDTLIEDALRIGGMRVKVVQLEKGSSLPSQTVIADSLAVIKLHGENQSTRADESIHDLPSLNDRNRFYNYFFPYYGYKKLPASHLFCLGTSLSDQRTNHLIKHVLSLKKNFKVFIAIARDQSKDKLLKTLGEEFEEQIFFTPPHNPEYVLYELYQRLTLRLPPGGFSYQYDQFIPPLLLNQDKLATTPSSEAGSENRGLKHDRETIADWLIHYLMGSKGADSSSPVAGLLQEYGGVVSGNIVSLRGGYGISTFAGSIFHKLVENRVRCLWLELEDFSTPFELLSQIFYSAMIQVGRLHHEAAQIEFGEFGSISTDKLADEIKEKIEGHIGSLKLSPRTWVIFVYGRNSPGECSGLNDEQTWGSEAFQKLHTVIKCLAAYEFKVVYMPSTEERSQRCSENFEVFGDCRGSLEQQDDEAYVKALHEDVKLPFKKLKDIYHFNSARSTAIKMKSHLDILLQTYRKPESWVELRFLYACSLFRQSRHFNSLISEAAFPCGVRFNYSEMDNDLLRGNKVQEWREQYSDLGIFLVKPGGYIWKYRDIRLGIKSCLEKFEDKKRKRRPFLAIKSRTHYWIGDWYHKALFATLHPTPLKEAIYHLVSAIQFAKDAKSKEPQRSDERFKYRFSIILRSMHRLSKIILHAKDRIPSWINEPAYECSLSANSITRAIVGDVESFDVSDDESVMRLLATLVGDEAGSEDSGWISEPFITTFRFALVDLVHECSLLSQYRKKSKGLNVVNGALNLRIGPFQFDDRLKNLNQRLSLDARGLHELDPWAYSNLMTRDYLKDIASTLRAETAMVNCSESVIQLADFLEKDLSDLIEEGKSSVVLSSAEDWREKAEKKCKGIKIKLVKSNFASPHMNSLCISILADVAHLLIRRAKILSRQLRSVEYLGVPGHIAKKRYDSMDPIEKRTWVAVTMLCSLGIDLCRFLPVSHIDFEMEAAAKLHALYGLALGNLNRFSEAFRRINESLTLNFFFYDTKKRHNNIACFLRRVEVILIQQRYEFQEFESFDPNGFGLLTGDQQRRLIQLLDRAYFNLGIAQESFPTENYEPFWRGRLIMLKMRIYCIYFSQKQFLSNISPRFLVNRLNLENEMYELFKSGVNECQSDCYRKLCFFDLFVLSLEFLKDNLGEGEKELMRESILNKDVFRGYRDLYECIPKILTLELVEENQYEELLKRKDLRFLELGGGVVYRLPFNYAARDLLCALLKRFQSVFEITAGPPKVVKPKGRTHKTSIV